MAVSKYRRRLTVAEQDEIHLRYERGESRSHIQRALGISHLTVTRHLQARGIRPENRSLRGALHPNRRDGRQVTPEGYVQIIVRPDHRFAAMRNTNGRVPEHRLVMAEALNRPLLPTETVHHINGKRDDNRLENLQLMTDTHPRGASLRCGACGSQHIVAEWIDEATWP